MIYIGSPYSSLQSRILRQRFEAVEHYAAQRLKQGEVVFSPIVHCHELAQKYSLPTDYVFWEKYCIGMLSKADTLEVIMLEDWERSAGLAAEIAYCETNGIPIKFISMEKLKCVN